MEPEMLRGAAALFAGLTIVTLLYALLSPTRKPKVNTDEVAEEIFGSGATTGSAEGIGKYVQPILRNFVPNLPENILMKSQEKAYTKLLRTSGNPWKISPEELLVLQIAFGVISGLLGVFVVIAGNVTVVPPIVIPLMLLALGALVPYSVHTSARENRANNIRKNLPEALDLMTVMIGAGKTFEPALREVTKQLQPGFLRDEFTRISIELQAGKTIPACMESFIASNAAESAETFSKAIIQSTRVGADVSETLTQQANFAREEYAARLAVMTAKLGTTMMIPMALFMLPAFMIIFTAPSISSLSSFMTGQ